MVDGAKIKGKPRLLLHAGTPKTGSSSLQNFFERNQAGLKSRGILYPQVHQPVANIYKVLVHKHQWLVTNLLKADEERYLSNVNSVISQLDDDIHTVVLSTEGLFNHWWDFPEKARKLLAKLNTWFDVRVAVVFREPVSFAQSFYKQVCLASRIETIYCYGRDLSIEQAIEDPWFAKHFDYAGFIEGCEEIFGPDSVLPLKYECFDIVIKFKRLLGLEDDFGEGLLRLNESLSLAGLELVRIINRFPLDRNEKMAAVHLVREIEAILSDCSSDLAISNETQKTIIELNARSRTILAKRYNLNWP